MADEAAAAARRAQRPGCITAYALLLFAAGGVAALGGILLAGSGEVDAAGMITLVIVGGLYVALARGLWLMRHWAWVVVLVLQGLNLLVGVITFFDVLASGGGINFPLLSGLWLSGAIMKWFAENGQEFD